MNLIASVRSLLPPKYRQFAKFVAVGGMAWTVDTVIFTVLANTVLSHKILTCKVISMTISTVLSYVLNREWSFNTRGGRRMHREMLLFMIFNGFGFVLNLAPLAISHYVIGINLDNGYSTAVVKIADWVSANIVGTLFGTVFRYWSYQKYVFPAKAPAADALAATSDRG